MLGTPFLMKNSKKHQTMNSKPPGIFCWFFFRERMKLKHLLQRFKQKNESYNDYHSCITSKVGCWRRSGKNRNFNSCSDNWLSWSCTKSGVAVELEKRPPATCESLKSCLQIKPQEMRHLSAQVKISYPPPSISFLMFHRYFISGRWLWLFCKAAPVFLSATKVPGCQICSK